MAAGPIPLVKETFKKSQDKKNKFLEPYVLVII
jgi:hypothetical protein